MNVKQLEAMIAEADTALRRLRVLYDQWFAGIERIEPQLQRDAFEKALKAIAREQGNNTGIRFRVRQLQQRYNTYNTYWKRVARQIEEGTYKRDVLRARRNRELREERQERQEVHELDFDLDLDLELDIDAMMSDALSSVSVQGADRATPEGPATPTSAPLPPPIPLGSSAPSPAAQGRPENGGGLNEDGLAAVARLPSIEPTVPNTGRRAQGTSRHFPAPPPSPAQPAALGSAATGSAALASQASLAPTQQGCEPPSARRQRPRIVAPNLQGPVNHTSAFGPPGPAAASSSPEITGPAPAPPPPKSPKPLTKAPRLARPPAPAGSGQVPAARRRKAPAPAPAAAAGPTPAARGDLSDREIRVIYDRYLEARKRNAQRTDNVRVETVAKTVRAMLPKLRQKHAGKRIDFEVVVKDGKVALKPTAH